MWKKYKTFARQKQCHVHPVVCTNSTETLSYMWATSQIYDLTFHTVPELLSLFLVFVFVGISSTKPWSVLTRLLLLGVILRSLIGVLGLVALSIVGSSMAMIVSSHLVRVTRWVRHRVVGIVSILGWRWGILGVGWRRNGRRWGRRGFLWGGWALGRLRGSRRWGLRLRRVGGWLVLHSRHRRGLWNKKIKM